MKSYVKPVFTIIKICSEEGIACFGSGNSGRDGFDFKPPHGGFFWGGFGNWFGGFFGGRNRG